MRKPCAVVALLLVVPQLTGCPPQSSLGLDLGVRGFLLMAIHRTSGSAQAVAAARINDTVPPFTRIDLTSDQSLKVNGVTLGPNLATILSLGLLGHIAADVGAVNAPGTYTITFDDRGEVSTMSVTPPMDFTSTTPAEGAMVSRSNFVVTWSPSGEDGVTITIELAGQTTDDDDDLDDDDDPDPYVAIFSGLADNGSATPGTVDLQPLLAGPVTLRIVRVRTVSQDVGFAGGAVDLRIAKETHVTLVD